MLRVLTVIIQRVAESVVRGALANARPPLEKPGLLSGGCQNCLWVHTYELKTIHQDIDDGRPDAAPRAA
jgi:hypothetical protein